MHKASACGFHYLTLLNLVVVGVHTTYMQCSDTRPQQKTEAVENGRPFRQIFLSKPELYCSGIVAGSQCNAPAHTRRCQQPPTCRQADSPCAPQPHSHCHCVVGDESWCHLLQCTNAEQAGQGARGSQAPRLQQCTFSGQAATVDMHSETLVTLLALLYTARPSCRAHAVQCSEAATSWRLFPDPGGFSPIQHTDMLEMSNLSKQ